MGRFRSAADRCAPASPSSSRTTGMSGRSRCSPDAIGFTVGVLVQANHGRRARFQVDGVPVGRVIGLDEVPPPRPPAAGPRPPGAGPPAAGPGAAPAGSPGAGAAGAGSVIVVAATDAPLLPNQCERLAQRA